jgi:hypothetical protein
MTQNRQHISVSLYVIQNVFMSTPDQPARAVQMLMLAGHRPVVMCHAIKICGGKEELFHEFLTPTLDGSTCSVRAIL